LSYWIVADTHFGHTKMIEIQNRPKNFERKILNNLEKTYFKDYDVLIHLGDFCLDAAHEEFWHNEYMKVLPKNLKKWLIIGNHDRKSPSWYYSHGWDCVVNQLIIKQFGKIIWLSHRPLYLQQIEDLSNGVNVHGHTHTNDYHKLNYHIPVIIEKIYAPLKLKTIIEKHDKGEM